MSVCGLSPFAMIINLLMWADVETSGNCSDNGDVVAWWSWMDIGLTIEPKFEEAVFSFVISLFMGESLSHYWNVVFGSRQCSASVFSVGMIG